jgi:hypothetical protein
MFIKGKVTPVPTSANAASTKKIRSLRVEYVKIRYHSSVYTAQFQGWEDYQIVRERGLVRRLARIIRLWPILLVGWLWGCIRFGYIGRVDFDRCFLHVAKHSYFTCLNCPEVSREDEEKREKEF